MSAPKIRKQVIGELLWSEIDHESFTNTATVTIAGNTTTGKRINVVLPNLNQSELESIVSELAKAMRKIRDKSIYEFELAKGAFSL